MYLSYYDLKSKPFQITTDPNFIWLGEKHQEGLAVLRYGIVDDKGFLLLTGEVGTGKTLLVNCLLQMIELDTIVTTIPNPGLDVLDFFHYLADGFGMPNKFNTKGEFLLRLREFLQNSYAAQKKVLLIVDEAQRLNSDLLEEIRLLSNIELNDRKLINIFFVGQNEFIDTLMESRNRALAQRITVKYNIDPLTKTEMEEYVRYRLKIAGADRKIITDDAVGEIYNFSRGIPRLINILCDRALLTGYVQGKKTLGPAIVRECADELKMHSKRSDGVSVSRPRMEAPEVKETLPQGMFRPGAAAAAPVEPSSRRSLRIAIPAFFALLVLVTGIYLMGLQRQDSGTWDADDLTSTQKYSVELKKRKEVLASAMEKEGAGMQSQAAPEASAGRADGDAAGEAPAPTDLPDNVEVPESETSAPKVQPGPEPATALSSLSDNRAQAAEAAGSVEAGTNLSPAAAAGAETVLSLDEPVVVHFKHNSNELNDEDLEKLSLLAVQLQAQPAIRVRIEGYTDSTGAESYNRNVSLFRANNVKSFLFGKGIDAERMQTVGMGSQKPVASNKTDAGRRENRRVEVILVGQSGD